MLPATSSALPKRQARVEKTLPGPLFLFPLLVQRAGLYAILFHKGSHAEQERALASFLSFLEERGLSHDEQIFCSDMLVYARQRDETAYVNKYSVRLCENADTFALAGKTFPLDAGQE